MNRRFRKKLEDKNMIDIDVTEMIYDVLDKYYDEEKGCYCKYRREDDSDINIKDELIHMFIDNSVDFKIDITDAFDSPGYDCSVLSIAYIQPVSAPDAKSLRLETLLLENM